MKEGAAASALERLGRLRRFGVKLGLERIEAVLAALGDPQRRYPSVHIAGTNGKGSTAAMIAAMLTRAGYRVGLFTSPHLNRFSERIRVGVREITPAQLEHVLERVLTVGPELTFFEVATAAALRHFADQSVDVAVVETGLGGRLDATNQLSPLLTAITSIDLDHAEALGPAVHAVAAEKAGIIKAGVPVVAGPAHRVAVEVIEARCAELEAPLLLLGRDFACRPADDSQRLIYSGSRGDLGPFELALAGRHQWDNAAIALAVVEQLDALGLHTVDREWCEALAVVRWPGRMEWVGNWLLDCAHNPAATRALAAALGERRDLCLVFGVTEGKAAAEMLEPLMPHAARVVFTRPDVDRALDPAHLLRYAPHAELAPDLPEAMAMLRDDPRDRVATGSIYLVGQARQLLCGGARDGAVLSDPAPGQLARP